MKKIVMAWLLVGILWACKEKHEPTLNEIVAGIYDTPSDWVLVDSIKVGFGCQKSYLVVKENELGLLDIKTTCRNLDFIEHTREVKGMKIRESLRKEDLQWASPGNILYELYEPQSNTKIGVFYEAPNSANLQIFIKAKTTKGDTIWVSGPKRDN